MNVIECHAVTKSHGSIKALSDLTVTIGENKITGLIGRNGAGKTTLLKILAGYWQETSGEVKVFSETPFDNLFVSANSIFIDDQMNFPESLSLMEILKQGERFYAEWDMVFAKRLFNYFQFDEKQIHASLSKGKKSTFNMLFGLATRCPLTMFDEPTTGMDAAVRKDFYRALLKDYLAHPRTIILSSHHLDEVEALIEDVLLIDQGKKFLHLPMEELKEYAIGFTGRNEVVAQAIGDHEVIYKNQMDVNHTYIVVETGHAVAKEAVQIGLKAVPVTPSDLAVYLTKRTKGGIDDVFIQD